MKNLENELRRVGINEPMRIEDSEVGIESFNKTNRSASHWKQRSGPVDPKTLQEDMDGIILDECELSA